MRPPITPALTVCSAVVYKAAGGEAAWAVVWQRLPGRERQET